MGWRVRIVIHITASPFVLLLALGMELHSTTWHQHEHPAHSSNVCCCPCCSLTTLSQGMELYSTVLWHLKRDVELAHLAQHALAVDRMAPEAW
jgi:hypothetical protein